MRDIKKFKPSVENIEESRRALINILEDVESERNKAEEERDKTLAIITNFADGLIVFNKEGNLSLINPQAEFFLEVKENDIIGKSILDLSAFPTIKPVVILLEKELKEIFRKEIQIKEDLILEISMISIMGEGKKIGSLITLHDVTREKMIEKMKTEFVSLTAHQLRTPLSAIKWTLSLLLEGDLGKLTPEQKDFLGKSYQSNERMINLINDLLDVSRIEEGRYVYKPIFTNMENLVESIINSFKEEIKKKKIKLEFLKPEKKLPMVEIDIEKLNIAIQNLLNNSISYISPGGQVTVSLKNDINKIEFSIKDTGVGIPQNQQKRIFTKFFRGTNAVKMETVGTGLGLFITKNIIEAHGGKIWFESREGKGTTFSFVIPVKQKSKLLN